MGSKTPPHQPCALHSADDVALLTKISMIAAAVHAPFVAAASIAVFGRERLSEHRASPDLFKTFHGAEYAIWNAFRESEDSRFVVLTLPRVRARLPYGRD